MDAFSDARAGISDSHSIGILICKRPKKQVPRSHHCSYCTYYTPINTTTMTTSSSLASTNNGGHSRGVFDAANEDDPLLQEPLFVLPNQHDFSYEQQAPPPESPSFGVFTKEKEESSRQKKRVVQYDTDNHLRVLFGMYGSVWPYVLPYCIVAVLITALINYLQDHDIVDLTFASSTGHNFMAIMVGTLLLLWCMCCTSTYTLIL